MALLGNWSIPQQTVGTFWKGADGNVWVAGKAGVHSAGNWDNNTQAYWGSRGYGLQSDPNAPQSTPQGNNNGNTGNTSGSHSNLTGSTITTTSSAGPAAPLYQDKTNDIAVQNAGLGSVDGQTQHGIDAINEALGKLKSNYATETAANEGNYKNESDSNMNTYQGGKQTALVNAASGRHGLLGTLASIGALSDDSIALANQAVQNGANVDLHGVSTTFANNQSGLDTAIGTYRREDKARNDTADTEAENSRKAEIAHGATTKQSFLTNLANDYQLEGKTAQGKTYSDQAAALYPTIAANNVPSGNLTPQQAAYTAPALSTYLGANNTAVQTTPTNGAPGSLPGLSALSGKKQQSTLVTA